MERLQKVLAGAGVASRRKCESLIASGRVTVNGKVAVIGTSVAGGEDICVDGKKIVLEKKVYIMLNKPVGFITTVSEQHGMRTVLDLVKVKERVFPVGRLDKYSEGLVLLTNDGELANKIMHPRYNVEKEYFVVANKPVDENIVLMLEKGVIIDDRKVVFSNVIARKNEVSLRVHEGRKHIIRRVFEILGFKVVRLIRRSISALSLGDLASGKWRFLTVPELKSLKSSLGAKNSN